jgi:predicted DNA-binding transcriptional regulator AlpA
MARIFSSECAYRPNWSVATLRELRRSKSTETKMEKPAYRISELLELSPIGRTTLFRAIRRGDLPARKIGRATIVLARDFEEFLANLPHAFAGGRH